jgi:uncharacterized membrane protein
MDLLASSSNNILLNAVRNAPTLATEFAGLTTTLAETGTIAVEGGAIVAGSGTGTIAAGAGGVAIGGSFSWYLAIFAGVAIVGVTIYYISKKQNERELQDRQSFQRSENQENILRNNRASSRTNISENETREFRITTNNVRNGNSILSVENTEFSINS